MKLVRETTTFPTDPFQIQHSFIGLTLTLIYGSRYQHRLQSAISQKVKKVYLVFKNSVIDVHFGNLMLKLKK